VNVPRCAGLYGDGLQQKTRGSNGITLSVSLPPEASIGRGLLRSIERVCRTQMNRASGYCREGPGRYSMRCTRGLHGAHNNHDHICHLGLRIPLEEWASLRPKDRGFFHAHDSLRIASKRSPKSGSGKLDSSFPLYRHRDVVGALFVLLVGASLEIIIPAGTAGQVAGPATCSTAEAKDRPCSNY
jgi:hypothetical protein